MPSPELIARARAARAAVLAQTERLHRDFGRAKSRWKSDGTRVTDTDLAISEGIIGMLSAEFPEDQFFSEEGASPSGPQPVTARFAWILDPIDGTNNFALGIPHCAISLGLVEQGMPAYGVVYDLSRLSLLEGGPEFAVTDGGRPAGIDRSPLTRSTLVGFANPRDLRLLPMANGVMSAFKIRGLGSATLHLAYVAVGLLAGSVDFNVKLWDLAGAIPLVLGAGGEVRFLNGEQLPVRQFDLGMARIVYLAGGPDICERLRQLMGPLPADIGPSIRAAEAGGFD